MSVDVSNSKDYSATVLLDHGDLTMFAFTDPAEWAAYVKTEQLHAQVLGARSQYDTLKANKRKATSARQRRRINEHIQAAKQNYHYAREQLKRYKTRQLLTGGIAREV